MPEGANVAVPGDYSLVKSSLSNKGNPTSQGFDNLMVVEAKQPVRIIDTKGNILFEGTGPEAARQAVAMGQNLSDTLGNKAGWDIQTVPVGTSNFKTIANEKVNKSTLQQIGQVVGTALPIAVSLIPGLQFAGPVLSSVLAGGAGAAMAGRDPLKGALTAGLTAGGAEYLGPILQGAGIGLKAADAARAVGTGIGATAGGLATGQNLKNSLLGGVAAGGLSYLGGQVFKPSQAELDFQSGLNSDVRSAIQGLSEIGDLGFAPSVGGLSAPSFAAPTITAPTPSSDIVLTGTRLPVSTGFNAGALTNLLPGPRYSGDGPTPETVVTAKTEPTVEDRTSPFTVPVATTAVPETVVTAQKDVPAVKDDYTRINPVVPDFNAGLDDEIVLTAPKKEVYQPEDKSLAVPIDVGSTLATVDNNPDITKGKDGLTTEQKLKLAALALSTLGGLGGGGGSGGGGTVPGGLGRLTSPVFDQTLSVLTPEQNRAKYGARNMTGTDWATWGSRPATSFFQNVQQQPTGMAHGGSLAAKRGGRSSFAVNGPGTGRSDDIPAVLSDGEYVMDAETVALLGDGSSKAGAKKLDDLRVKVRKHKGKKLAQGRFSANAKSPEAYLSGGRT